MALSSHLTQYLFAISWCESLERATYRRIGATDRLHLKQFLITDGVLDFVLDAVLDFYLGAVLHWRLTLETYKKWRSGRSSCLLSPPNSFYKLLVGYQPPLPHPQKFIFKMHI